MLFKANNQKGSIINRDGNDENNYNIDKLRFSFNELSMQVMPTLKILVKNTFHLSSKVVLKKMKK
jgi:hypothetical protein